MVGQGSMPGAELRLTVLPRDYFGRFRIGMGVNTEMFAEGLSCIGRALAERDDN